MTPLKTYSRNLKKSREKCRFCLEEIAKGVKLFTMNSDILYFLQNYLKIPLENNDVLAQNICPTCCQFTEEVFNFVEKCRTSYESLLREVRSTPSIPVPIYNIISDFDNNEGDDEAKPERITPKNACKYCNREFSTHSSLKRHLKTHFNSKSHQCVICGQKFTQSCVLKRHLFTHNFFKPYSCHFCSKGFIQKVNLSIHIKKRHLQMKERFSCEKCGKCFRYQSGLSRHIATHVERKFRCFVCFDEFTDKKDFHKHSERCLPPLKLI